VSAASGPRCHPRAIALFEAALTELPTRDGLLRGAIAIAAHEHPEIDEAAIRARLDALAGNVARRVPSGNARALLAHAHVVLFEEEGFRGVEAGHYDDPHNSFVDHVLETRRGLPITLVLVYTQVLARLGLDTHGLDSPGHFLARVRLTTPTQEEMIVDPFAGGRVLGVEEARALLGRLFGAVPSRERLLRRATNAGWLGRMLRNLMGSYTRRGRTRDRRAMEELHDFLVQHTQGTEGLA
jgi:regulator of sirC expression with transglutaminase-like and TPR domain